MQTMVTINREMREIELTDDPRQFVGSDVWEPEVANRETVNTVMGEREADIAQSWRNGYNASRKETAKEFAQKALKHLWDNYCIAAEPDTYWKGKKCAIKEAMNCIKELAAEFDSEVR